MHLDFGHVEFNVQPSHTRRSYSKDLQVTKICTGLNKFKIFSHKLDLIWVTLHYWVVLLEWQIWRDSWFALHPKTKNLRPKQNTLKLKMWYLLCSSRYKVRTTALGICISDYEHHSNIGVQWTVTAFQLPGCIKCSPFVSYKTVFVTLHSHNMF